MRILITFRRSKRKRYLIRTPFISLLIIVFSILAFSFVFKFEAFAQEFSKGGRSKMSLQNDVSLEDGKEYLLKYDNGFRLESMLKARDVFDGLISEDRRNYRYYYYSALAYYNLANIYEREKNREDTLNSIETGIKRAKASIVLNKHFSDSHRLLGELYGRLITYKGALSGMKYGPKGKDELLKALELDPQNAKAYIGLGIWKLHAPRLFGGSITEAIEDFNKAIEISPDLFEGYVWLGIRNVSMKMRHPCS